MTNLAGPLTVALMIFGGIGLGAVVLAAGGILAPLARHERIVWSFVAGIGAIGWINFFPPLLGVTSSAALALPLVVGLGGLVLLRRPSVARERALQPVTFITIALGLALAAVAGFDLLKGMAPPTDADSLAYHFHLAKRFLEENRLVFVPRAIDGAVPLLQSITYMTALGIGGERAMTLWATASGWSAAAGAYALSRRHVGRDWALLVALLVATTPAVIYAAGGGQVEVRSAAFTLLAAFAITEAVRTNEWQWAMLSGVAAGFAAASKYTGLLVVVSMLATALLAQRRTSSLVVIAVGAAATGTEWYAWNWWNTGDPIFPMLYDWLPYHPGVPWNDAQNASGVREYATIEITLPKNLWSFLVYPFLISAIPDPAFEARRVGLGPLLPLLAPFVLLAVWNRRTTAFRSPLAIYALVAFTVYALWFFVGPSQRARFLVPVYPLLVIAAIAATERAIRDIPLVVWPATVGLAAVAVLQVGMAAMFAAAFARYPASGWNREEFLSRMVPLYPAASWVRRNLPADAVVLTQFRQLLYYFDRDSLLATPFSQAMVEVRPDSRDPGLFWQQLQRYGVTHLLIAEENVSPADQSSLWRFSRILTANSCASVVETLPVSLFPSRTFSGYRLSSVNLVVIAIAHDSCRFASTERPLIEHPRVPEH